MLKLGELQRKRQTEGVTIESFDVTKKEWIQLGEVQLKLPNNILDKVGLEGHSMLRVTTFYSKIIVRY